ncbi:hypothetical protein PISMIDRAFT_689169, partial [Pisolithus microcarpus 441]
LESDHGESGLHCREERVPRWCLHLGPVRVQRLQRPPCQLPYHAPSHSQPPCAPPNVPS